MICCEHDVNVKMLSVMYSSFILIPCVRTLSLYFRFSLFSSSSLFPPFISALFLLFSVDHLGIVQLLHVTGCLQALFVSMSDLEYTHERQLFWIDPD